MLYDYEEMQRKLKERAQRSAQNRGKTGLGAKTVLDMSAAGEREVSLYKMLGGPGVENVLDFLPFPITQDWYQNMQEPTGAKNGLEVGLADYKLEYAIHRRQGEAEEPVLCLRKTFGHKCPICEALQELWDIDKGARTQNQEKMIKFLMPSWRCTYNIYDYNNPEAGIMLWRDASYKLFEEILQGRLQIDPQGFGAFSDLTDGLTVVFEGREKSIGKNSFFEAAQFSFDARNEPWPIETLDDVFPLDQMLVIPTYDEVARIYMSLEVPPNMDDDDDPGPTPEGDAAAGTTTRTRSTGTRRSAPTTAEVPDSPKCPIGGSIGDDYNAFNECDQCNAEVYQTCASLSPDAADPDDPDDPGPAAGGEPDPPTPTPRTRTAGADTPPAATGRTRTRGAAPATDASATTGHVRTRTRG